LKEFKDQNVELAIKYIPEIYSIVFRDKEKKFKLTFMVNDNNY